MEEYTQEEEETMMEAMTVHFEDHLGLEEPEENKIVLVGLLVADRDPPQGVVKEVLKSLRGNFGVVKVIKAKENVYSITVGDGGVAARLMDGNPWFIKGFTFTVKIWPDYHSLDDITADRALFWVQAHGIPRQFCTTKNAKCLGEKIGSVLEVEDIKEAGFRGFVRMRIDLDASKPLTPGFFMPCPVQGRRKIMLRYEGLKDFCSRCGRLGHSKGCQWGTNTRLEAEGFRYDEKI